MEYDYKKYGLLCQPDLKDENGNNLNDEDWIQKWVDNAKMSVPREFSDGNADVLRNTIRSLKNCKVILEIGVNKNAEGNCSSQIFFSEKSLECLYLGVDILPRLTEDPDRNIRFVQTNSSNHDEVMNYLKFFGHDKIDLLMIDGWHSVNQVLKDWQYTEWLSSDGCVILHDTNIHPGPVELLKAIDQSCWKIEQHFKNQTDDWGISVLWKKLKENSPNA